MYTQCNCISQPNFIPELLTALPTTTAVEFYVKSCELNITSQFIFLHRIWKKSLFTS